MDSFPEQNSKQASKAEPTIEEIKNWDADELLKWIKDNRPKLLKDDQLEEFKAKDISGDVFVDHAGDVEFFENKCNLPIEASSRLTNLAREMAGGETAGVVQKWKKQDTSTSPNTRKRKSSPHADTAPSTKRTRVGNSSLIINGKLKHFKSGPMTFSQLLQREGQAYFDRTRYISKLHKLDTTILFCRPRRFGKSLTISMLEHFHGLQYANEHQSSYRGLDVQKDIDEGKANPGQYFVLKFDFSEIPLTRPDLTEANEVLKKSLNSSLETFYRKYTAYLGGNFTDLCQEIDSKEPQISLRRCAELVRHAIEQDEQLAGIEGIYVLVDEHDALSNAYLEPSKTVERPKAVERPEIAWEEADVGLTFKAFWATIKILCAEGIIQRTFITGISPLSLSSAFNVARNVSFHRDLAGLCGLTYSDLEDALKGIYKDPKAYNGFLSEMTKFFNGYHFCKGETVGTVYNTERCLAYLQCRIERVPPETEDPENSEVSKLFLRRFAASPLAVRDFEKALEYDEKGDFAPLQYGRFKHEFTLRDLSGDGYYSSWRPLIVYFGGLTFHPKMPTTHLKIPNSVAADRIALAVLKSYDLRNSFEEALRHLIDDGELERTLGCYRALMMQRDITVKDLTQTRESEHRDYFYFCLLRNHYLVPCAEFQVIKPNNTDGRIYLLFQAPGRLIVTEWKFYRINFLNVRVSNNGNEDLTKAATLCSYGLPEILRLRFSTQDQHHRGTIRSWVMGHECPQLRDYIKSAEVQQLVETRSLELQAHFVIVVGSRHILLWDMNKDGLLAPEPRLVELPRRSKRQDGRGY